MDEISDVPLPKSLAGTKYSQLSLVMALLTFAVSIVVAIRVVPGYERRAGAMTFWTIDNIGIIAIFTSSILGIIFTVLSFRRKEQHSFSKWAGAILNGLIFAFWAMLFIAGIVLGIMGK